MAGTHKESFRGVFFTLTLHQRQLLVVHIASLIVLTQDAPGTPISRSAARTVGHYQYFLALGAAKRTKQVFAPVEAGGENGRRRC
jgi:hypothetical protein